MTKEYMEFLLSELSTGFYVKQVMVIVGLFLLGVLLLQICSIKMEQKWLYLLAFPMGLALWCIAGFLILTLGIPFSAVSVFGVIITGMAILFWRNYSKLRTERIEEKQTGRKKTFIFAICIVLIAACVATSGLLSLSVSNDTMYYYLYYPEMLMRKGGYTVALDTFLSDVGPMSAIIGTLPSMFGFDQIYGIHQFFNLNFIIIFLAAVFEKTCTQLSKKTSVMIAVIGTIILVTSTPYLVISKWVLANAYVMYYSFILLYLADKYHLRNADADVQTNRFSIMFWILIGMISMLRMEGCVVACFIIICMSTLRYSNKELIYSVMVPTLLFPSLYYIRYFVLLRMSPLNGFLTWQKAVLILFAMFLLLMYLVFVRGKRLKGLQSRMRLLLLLAMFVGNGILFLTAPSHYMVVIKAFFENISGRQGWGYTVELMVLCYAVVCVLSCVLKGTLAGHRDVSYEDLIFIGYLFVLFAVSYARGGGLRYGIGDSGNRVMMQMVPFAWYAIISKAICLVKEFNNVDYSKCR